MVQKRQIPEVHVLKEMQKMYPMLTEEFVRKNIKNVDMKLIYYTGHTLQGNYKGKLLLDKDFITTTNTLF